MNEKNDYPAIKLSAQAEILEKYKSKKTPDGRRDCIKQMAKDYGLKDREVAEFLLAAGLQVDGRLVRNAKTRPVTPALGPKMPGWDGPEEVVEEPETGSDIRDALSLSPLPAAETQQEAPERCETAAVPEEDLPDYKRCMKVGVLIKLLRKVDPRAPIFLDGEGYLGGIHVPLTYDATGEKEEAEVGLHPLGY